MKTVEIPLEIAERIVEMLPRLSDMDVGGKRAFYEICSGVNRALHTPLFRPRRDDVFERKIACIKAWKGALKIGTGEMPGLRESKEAVEEGEWIKIEDIGVFKEAVSVFSEAGISLEYK